MDIDVVVSYVDENDKDWLKDFNYYKDKEIKEGKQKPTNAQAFAEERTRDWDAFRFWFRGIEKNCPWVHKVFLVVQRESQIPSWLDRNNPKLRIVYHSEFVPEELLPTFSTFVIQPFYYRIPDLSEHFIVSDDDFFFLNKIPEDLFFKDGKIIQGITPMRKKNWSCNNKDWEKILSNNNNFLEKYIIKHPVNEFYHYSHLPDGRVKSFDKDFMDKYYNIVYDSISVSKFRHPKNLITSQLYIDAMKYTNYGIQSDRVYKRSKYVNLSISTNFNECSNYEMICFNDTASVGKDFEKCRDNLFSFFIHKFPEKSSFELTDVEKKEEKIETKVKPVFGIISWLPDKEPDRTQRIDRLNKMISQLMSLFGDDIHFMIVAQNWKDYKLPESVKNVTIFKYNKLGILGARKTLGKHFLESDYDYLIMCDDDIVLQTGDGFSREYFFDELNKHPNGFMFLQYGWSLTFCAISKFIYKQSPMVDIDPEKGEGYEDVVYPHLLINKHPKAEFHIYGIQFVQHTREFRKDCKSTWDSGVNHKKLHQYTDFYINRFKQGKFDINFDVKHQAELYVRKQEWLEEALYRGWINKSDVDKYR